MGHPLGVEGKARVFQYNVESEATVAAGHQVSPLHTQPVPGHSSQRGHRATLAVDFLSIKRDSGPVSLEKSMVFTSQAKDHHYMRILP